MASRQSVDFLVIGAGMAGASVAYELAARGSVLLVEREDQPGVHSTGRSAALFSGIYGNATVRSLSRASRAFLSAPPDGFTAQPLLSRRGCLFAAPAEDAPLIDRLQAEEGAAVRRLSQGEARDLVPILRPEACAAALLERDAFDIDVNALHQGYLGGLRRRGGTMLTGAAPLAPEAQPSSFAMTLGGQEIEANVVINAAGAWADAVGEAFGAAPLGLSPRRRTVVLIEAPDAAGFDRWPCVIDAAESYYFKPDAGRLLVSPADETPSPPCDAQPEEYDIALAVDRFEKATTHPVRRISHRWAGLRTFASDRTPVCGFDPVVPRFFWLAGQGGYGIQTAPAMAMLAAALASGAAPPAALGEHGVEPAALTPARFAGV